MNLHLIILINKEIQKSKIKKIRTIKTVEKYLFNYFTLV